MHVKMNVLLDKKLQQKTSAEDIFSCIFWLKVSFKCKCVYLWIIFFNIVPICICIYSLLHFVLPVWVVQSVVIYACTANEW